jgi:hypothetical protein
MPALSALMILFGLMFAGIFILFAFKEKLQIILKFFLACLFISFLANSYFAAMIFKNQRYDLDDFFKNNTHLTLNHASEDALNLPDIYYIIPDGYANQHALNEYFNLSNQSFISDLEEKGFFIAPCGHSNYIQTLLSVSSIMNMDYLHNDIGQLEHHYADRLPIMKHFMESRLEDILLSHNYEIHEASSGFLIQNENKNYRASISAPEFSLKPWHSFINQTPIVQLLNLFVGEKNNPLNIYKIHRDSVLKSFADLKDITTYETQQPKFVFAHFMIPHTPFVFDADGAYIDHAHVPFSITNLNKSFFEHEFKNGWDTHYTDYYGPQIAYTNQLLKNAIDHIKAQKRDRPLVIILQADHGSKLGLNRYDKEDSRLDEVFSVLNAFYFSDGYYDRLQPDMSNVNTFRIVLNKYFGQDLALLENKAFFTKDNTPYSFEDVTDRVNVCGL